MGSICNVTDYECNTYMITCQYKKLRYFKFVFPIATFRIAYGFHMY
jgi:hypothetical protein